MKKIYYLNNVTYRLCDTCKQEYKVDMRNFKRGWGRCCSKKCAAKKREENKPTYNTERVKLNNLRRKYWNINNSSLDTLTDEDYYFMSEHSFSSEALGQWDI